MRVAAELSQRADDSHAASCCLLSGDASTQVDIGVVSVLHCEVHTNSRKDNTVATSLSLLNLDDNYCGGCAMYSAAATHPFGVECRLPVSRRSFML